MPASTKIAPIEQHPTILIDPGHGGVDGGAVSIDGVIEKDINLALSLDLADFFRCAGYQVIMTRQDDRSIHDEGVTGIHDQKVSDLNNRLALIQQHPEDILLSIHQNTFSQSRYSGGQVFYGSKKPETSKRLAETIQHNLKEMLQPGNDRKVKETYNTIYLMRHAPITAALVECGFLSNPEEAQLLQQPQYRRKLAFVIFTSTLQYLQEETQYGHEV